MLQYVGPHICTDCISYLVISRKHHETLLLLLLLCKICEKIIRIFNYIEQVCHSLRSRREISFVFRIPFYSYLLPVDTSRSGHLSSVFFSIRNCYRLIRGGRYI
jgi:hypothetical protein